NADIGEEVSSGGSKDTNASPSLGPDFDPFAPKPEKPKDASATSKTPGDQSLSQARPGQSEPINNTSLLSDDTYDDSQNMRVSRSGRFKEKRRVRSSLPIEQKDSDQTTAGKEDSRLSGGGKGGDRM
uniref:Uncharacterized protein n=1 Tax=Myripristis murdjan TaxID=586833 RepID=A0A668AR93_9TELE